MFSYSFHKNFFIAAILFIAAGIIYLFTLQPWWILVPFILVSIKPFQQFIIHKTSWIFYLLFFLLPLSTEVNITPALGIDFPDEVVMLLLTGFSTLIFICKPVLFPKEVLYHPLFLLLVIHVIWIGITCIYSTDSLLSVKFLLAKFWFVIPFVVLPSLLITTKKSFLVVGWLLIIPMSFVVIQSLIRHSFHQYSFEGIKYTLSPFFRNHVTYSAMLVCLLPVLIGLRMQYQGKINNWINVLILVNVIAVVFAYSRGAWLALICGIIAAVALYYHMMKWLILFSISGIVVATLWLGYQKNYLRLATDYNTTIFHEDIGAHLQATVQLKDVSNAERFYRWVAATNMIAAKPVVGFGPNTFYNNYKEYTERPFRTWVSNNPEHSTVHNYFLLVMIEQGVVGFVLFAALFIVMLLYSQKLFIQLHDKFYKGVAMIVGVLLAMIGTINFSSDLIETDKMGSLFWLCLGVLFVLQKQLPVTTGSNPVKE